MLNDDKHKLNMFRGLSVKDNLGWLYGWPVYSNVTKNYYITNEKGESLLVYDYTLGKFRFYDKDGKRIYDYDVIGINKNNADTSQFFKSRAGFFMYRNRINELRIYLHTGEFNSLYYTIYFITKDDKFLTVGDIFSDAKKEDIDKPYGQTHNNLCFLKDLQNNEGMRYYGDVFTTNAIPKEANLF